MNRGNQPNQLAEHQPTNMNRENQHKAPAYQQFKRAHAGTARHGLTHAYQARDVPGLSDAQHMSLGQFVRATW